MRNPRWWEKLFERSCSAWRWQPPDSSGRPILFSFFCAEHILFFSFFLSSFPGIAATSTFPYIIAPFLHYFQPLSFEEGGKRRRKKGRREISSSSFFFSCGLGCTISQTTPRNNLLRYRHRRRLPLTSLGDILKTSTHGFAKK